MNHVHWALLGMVGYSLVTLFVKLATRNGVFSGFVVLTISIAIVMLSTVALVLYRGDFQYLKLSNFIEANALWSYAAGISLAVAVTSLFMGLSLGSASVVVPIYGMFVVGGSVLGFIFLGESLDIQKVVGIVFAVVGIYLITR